MPVYVPVRKVRKVQARRLIAFQRGWDAYKDAWGVHENPFRGMTAEWHAWREGWREARRLWPDPRAMKAAAVTDFDAWRSRSSRTKKRDGSSPRGLTSTTR